MCYFLHLKTKNRLILKLFVAITFRWTYSFTLTVFLRPTFLKPRADYFLTLITEEHPVDFVRLFLSNPTKFKQHKLTHYPTILSRSGPLINLCVLKYERKHQWFKRLTHETGIFKNVPKTYAVRYQSRQYASWRNGFPVKAKPEYSAGTSRDVESVIGTLLFDAEPPLINVNNKSFSVAKKVTIRGTVLSQHNVLILYIDDSWPVLALIESVFAGEKEPVFACVLLDVVEHCFQSRSYLINCPSNSCHGMLKKNSDLHDYHPLSLHLCFDISCSWFHVILRQKVGYNNSACLIWASGLGLFANWPDPNDFSLNNLCTNSSFFWIFQP